MTIILVAVTLFVAVLAVLNVLPQYVLRKPLMIVRAHVSTTRFELDIWIACQAFLVEWRINGRDVRDRPQDGIRVLLDSENWWTRELGEAVSYRRLVIDSIRSES